MDERIKAGREAMNPSPSDEEMRKLCEEILTQCTNDIYYGAPNRSVCTLARYVLERLGEQGKLTVAVRKLAITTTAVQLNAAGLQRTNHCSLCAALWLNDFERHEADCVLASPSKAGEPQGWQPISSAPKDGTEILLFKDYRFIGKYSALGFGDGGWWVSNALPVEPTLWRPLPKSPDDE